MNQHRTRGALLLVLVLAHAACGGADAGPRVQVERDTLGDTIVVRTLAGSLWGDAELVPEVRIGVFEGDDAYMFGEVRSLAVAPDGSIYVMDGQVPALRKYTPDGGFIATFGRRGGGPGEYERPDGGLVVLSDGRVVLRDPANARLQVYAPDGTPLDTWPIRGGFNTSNPMVADTADRIYTQVLLDPQADVMEWRSGMVAYETRTGQPVDTIPAPEYDYQEARLVARFSDGDNNSTSVNNVPFSPRASWAFSPLGHMVGALSTRYAVEQFLPDGRILRIERVDEPVPVRPAEKANEQEMARWNMRQTQPDWKWNGPSIPDTKPPLRGVATGLDGRLWVQVHQPGEPVPEDEIETTDRPDARPPRRWRERVAYDVFEPDGTYLGRAVAPPGFSIYPRPVFRGDEVWAVVRDEMDVQYVTRFRVRAPGTGRVAAELDS